MFVIVSTGFMISSWNDICMSRSSLECTLLQSKTSPTQSEPKLHIYDKDKDKNSDKDICIVFYLDQYNAENDSQRVTLQSILYLKNL